MKIYQSVNNSYIVQKFGEKNTFVNVMPFYKELGLKGHNGWDWSAKDGDKIYYDCDIEGTVISVCTDLNAGYGIEILTESKEGIFKHRYWHLRTNGILVKPGQKVKIGDLIGLADNTGKYTTGTHLHRDLKQCTYQQNGVLEVLNKNNGYSGCIDIEPYFLPTFSVVVAQKIEILQKIIFLYNQLIEMFKIK